MNTRTKSIPAKDYTEVQRRVEYERIRQARAEIDRQTGEINDALCRLEYLIR